jgi:SH3-like domain-containing protein
MLSGKLSKGAAMVAYVTRVFLIVSISFVMTYAASLAQDNALEASARLAVRSNPSVDSRIISVIRKGTGVLYRDCKDGWCKVNVGKQTGYVLQGLLKECDNCMPVMPK